MKKTPILLGAMASVLAIAGAFTTKGNTKVVKTQGFTANGTEVTVPCSGSINTCQVRTAQNGLTTVFTSVGGAVIHTSN